MELQVSRGTTKAQMLGGVHESGEDIDILETFAYIIVQSRTKSDHGKMTSDEGFAHNGMDLLSNSIKSCQYLSVKPLLLNEYESWTLKIT